MKLKVSVSCYNEVNAALERVGIQADSETELTLVKGTQLESPVDFKMAVIRRDVMGHCAPVYKDRLNQAQSFIEFVDENYQYILYGRKQRDEWK